MGIAVVVSEVVLLGVVGDEIRGSVSVVVGVLAVVVDMSAGGPSQ